MKYLRKAAARERRAPILWWFLMAAAMGGMLCVFIWPHSRDGAIFLSVLLGAAWLAPLVAFLSLSAPRRATVPAPAPGEGSFSEWMKQARLLGRVLLYYEDNKEFSKEDLQSIHDARKDLRDTLRAHPLRDDLERVCGRIRSGVLRELKVEIWRKYQKQIQELTREVDHEISLARDEDERLLAIHMAIENAAALMARHCMPRMLERERLACAVDCAWLAAQAAPAHKGDLTPIELAARLVIEWSDFSEPWQPARMLRSVLATLEITPSEIVSVSTEAPSVVAPAPRPIAVASPSETTSPLEPAVTPPAESSPEAVVATPLAPKRRRVKVRVRREHSCRSRKRRGPSIIDILLSFGQWVRYSVRSWMLYR